MALYSIRSERQFCERLQYDLLFRWFLDLNPDETTFDHSTFSQNQSRLLQHKVADLFFAEVVWLAKNRGWVSDQHFSVDATLIESWASLKSFKPKKDDRDGGPGDGNGWADFKGQKRRNDTHESTTDPEAKLGREAKLAFAGHATMENRHGLCVLFEVHPAVGASEAGPQALPNASTTTPSAGTSAYYSKPDHFCQKAHICPINTIAKAKKDLGQLVLTILRRLKVN